MRLKNEVLVGIVVVAGLLVLAVGGWWLTGRPWAGEQRELVAAFKGVGLLSEGGPVKYRGVQIGRVERIALSPRGIGVFVTMSVNPEVELPADAGVVLAPESFFGDWQASIVSRNDPAYRELDFTFVPGRNVLPGAALPDITELTAVAARIAGDIEILSDRVSLAFTEETAIKIRETIENVQEVSEQLSGFIDQQTDVYAAVGQNVLQATQNIEQTTAEVQRVTGQFGAAVDEGEIQAIITNARVASENLRGFSEQLDAAGRGVPGLIARTDTTLVSIGGLVRGLEPQLQQVGPTLQQAQEALATLQRAATRIEEGEGTLGRLLEDPALYEETQRAVASLQRFLADLQANPGKYIGKVRIF